MNQKQIVLAREYLQSQYPDFPIPSNSYLVLSSARSGSTLLCSHLENLGHGRPIEAFNPNKNHRLRYNWGIDYTDPCAYIKKAIDYQTVNGVFGMKFHPNQFSIFLFNATRLLAPAKAILNDAELVSVFFPETKYIHLQRKNKIKQAISFSKALQNGIWHETVDQDDEYKKYLMPALYDREHIECCFDLLISNDISWQFFLKRNELPYFPIWYEELASHYMEKMGEIYKYLDISNDEVISPPLRKQSNRESLEWEDRFASETPWFTESRMVAAYQSGDLDEMHLLRSTQMIQEKEQKRWKEMPAIRYKRIRSLGFRLKRKLSSFFSK